MSETTQLALEATKNGALEKPPRVEVELEPALGDEALTAALQSCGEVKITAKTLQDLKRVGVTLRGMGVRDIQRGQVLLSQGKCNEVEDMLRSAMAARLQEKTKPKSLVADMTRLALAFAAVLGKKTDVQRLALEMEQGAPSVPTPPDPGEPGRLAMPGFVPGRQIVPAGGTLVVAKTVNMSPRPEPTKPVGG